MSEQADGTYGSFFKRITAFKSLQNKQKQRGLNNYNLLTAVLSSTDEVRLHSRMIYSLLNPNGKHFQGTLFLEKFLKVLNLEDFILNLDRCLVYKEYENIDLYITDGTKHIIIENKVHAGDQKNQIKRYLELIKKENEDANTADILVLYLTLDRKEPSAYSLGDLSIEDDKIMKVGLEEALYKSVSYKAEIMDWLENCRHEVQNITNLNQAIVAYKDVVKMVNKEYKGEAMSLADYIKNEDVYAMAVEVSRAVPKVRKSIADTYFSNVVCKLQKELGDDWVVEIKGDLSTRYSFPLRIYKEEWDKSNSIIVGFEFAKNDYHNCYLGVVRGNDTVRIKNDIVEKFKGGIDKLDKKLKTTAWWLDWEWFYNSGDFIEYIRTEKNAELNLVNSFLSLITVFEKDSNLLTEINKDIKHSV